MTFRLHHQVAWRRGDHWGQRCAANSLRPAYVWAATDASKCRAGLERNAAGTATHIATVQNALDYGEKGGFSTDWRWSGIRASVWMCGLGFEFCLYKLHISDGLCVGAVHYQSYSVLVAP